MAACYVMVEVEHRFRTSICGRGREVVEVEAVIGESLIYSECDRISLTLRCCLYHHQLNTRRVRTDDASVVVDLRPQ